MTQAEPMGTGGTYLAWWIAGLGAAALLTTLGYSFELNDQLQYLLLPYRSIYPDFAPDDWFTWKTSHYHVSFSWIVRGLHQLSGERYFPHAVFAAHLLNLLWLCLAITRMAQAHGAGLPGMVVAITVLALVRHEGVAGATLNHAQLLPADLALPPMLLALSAWINGRSLHAGLWLGLSGLLHSNYALLGPMVVGLGEIAGLALAGRSNERGLWQEWGRMAAGYLLFATPSLWLIARTFLIADTAPEAVDTVFRVRSPHHYDLSALGSVDLWWPLFLLAWAAPALWRQRQERRSRAALMAYSVTAWLTVGVLGIWLEVGPLIRLFFFRLSPVLILLLLLSVGGFLDQVRRSQREARTPMLLWAATGVLGLCSFARSDMELLGVFGLESSLFGLPAVFAVALAGLAAMRRARAPAVLAAAIAAVAAVQAARAEPIMHERRGAVRKPVMRGPRVGRFVWNHQHAHVKDEALMSWVRNNTPTHAVFLIPPSLISFRLRTRRAVFVDFKAAPMRGEEVQEWKRRMLLAMGTEDFPTVGYPLRFVAGERFCERPLHELAKLARAEDLDYIVSRHGTSGRKSGLRRVANLEEYSVYQVMRR